MSELKRILREIEREFGLDHCLVCLEKTGAKDMLGFPWCEEHIHHGHVLTWGYRHGYPELDLSCMYTIGPGEHAWWMAVIGSAQTAAWQGHEDFMWIVLAYIEECEKQEKAS